MEKININSSVSNVFFLAGSGLTAMFAPNDLVFIGGAGLGIASSLYLVNDLTKNGLLNLTNKFAKSNIFEVGTLSCLVANGALTANGINLVLEGMNNNQNNLVMAGLCLTVANSVFYGVANIANLANFERYKKTPIRNLISPTPEAHGLISAAAGVSISLAGVFLNDPMLTTIGICFATDGSIRSKLEIKNSLQSFKKTISSFLGNNFH